MNDGTTRTRSDAWVIEFTYKRPVRFDSWEDATAAIREIRTDLIMARVTESNIQSAKSAGSLS